MHVVSFSRTRVRPRFEPQEAAGATRAVPLPFFAVPLPRCQRLTPFACGALPQAGRAQEAEAVVRHRLCPVWPHCLRPPVSTLPGAPLCIDLT